MAPSDFSDDLFESMAPCGERTPASQELREAVLRQTTQAIRNRRRMRHAKLATMFIGCYLGGVATVSLWPAVRTLDRFAPGSTVRLAHTGDPVSEPHGRILLRPEDDQIVNAGMPQIATRLSPYERLCRAGDQQLEKHDDIPAAMRSYKKALQLASADQRSISPDHDTWLLMALKQSIN